MKYLPIVFLTLSLLACSDGNQSNRASLSNALTIKCPFQHLTPTRHQHMDETVFRQTSKDFENYLVDFKDFIIENNDFKDIPTKFKKLGQNSVLSNLNIDSVFSTYYNQYVDNICSRWQSYQRDWRQTDKERFIEPMEQLEILVSDYRNISKRDFYRNKLQLPQIAGDIVIALKKLEQKANHTPDSKALLQLTQFLMIRVGNLQDTKLDIKTAATLKEVFDTWNEIKPQIDKLFNEIRVIQ